MSNRWPTVPLSEVLRPQWRDEAVVPQTEYRLLGAHWYAKGLYIKEEKLGAEIKASRLYRVERGDFVYNRLFAWKGSFAVASDPHHGCYVSNEFPCFRINEARLDANFLWFYFGRESAWNEALGLSHGATPTSRNRLKESNLLAMSIPLPPLFDQRRIVAKIEQLASKIAEARGLRANAKAEMIALESNETEECFCQLTKGGVNSASFEAVCDRITVGHVSSMRHAYCETGIPFLRSQNVRKNRFEPDGLCYIGREFHEANPKSKVQPGHVVIVRTGFVGIACVIPDELSEANCADLVIVHPGKGLDPHYASRFLNSLGGIERATDASVGSAQKHYNVKAMRKTLIPMPPLPEQRRIVAYLDDLQAKVDQLKTLQAQTAAELDALLPSILDRAFRGEL